MHRITIVGSGGAGKSTLAGCLSARLGLPHTELDSLYWRPNWQAAILPPIPVQGGCCDVVDGRGVRTV